MIYFTKKNEGDRTPEKRLLLGLPAAVLSSIGLVVWGLSVDRHWHWIVGQIAFFLCESFPYLWAILLIWASRCARTADGEYGTVELYRGQLSELCQRGHHVLLGHHQRESAPVASVRMSANSDLSQLSAFILPWFIFYWVDASGMSMFEIHPV